jgi:hypothetical protein
VTRVTRQRVCNGCNTMGVSSIWVQLKSYLWLWCYRKWSHVQPEVARPELEVIACTCTTGTFCTTTIVVVQNVHMTDRATGSAPKGVPLGMRNRKLHNIHPSGAFWPEVMSSNVTRSDGRGVRMHNRKRLTLVTWLKNIK